MSNEHRQAEAEQPWIPVVESQNRAPQSRRWFDRAGLEGTREIAGQLGDVAQRATVHSVRELEATRASAVVREAQFVLHREARATRVEDRRHARCQAVGLDDDLHRRG